MCDFILVDSGGTVGGTRERKVLEKEREFCRKCSHDIAYGALEYISGVKIGRNRSTFAFVNFSFKKLFF